MYVRILGVYKTEKDVFVGGFSEGGKSSPGPLMPRRGLKVVGRPCPSKFTAA